MWVTSAGETPTQNIAVYRVEQGRRVLVADELPAQGSVNDYFAPTGTTTYQVVVTNTLGQTSSATTAITNTGSRHITLTTQDKKIAYLYWNPEVSHALNTYKANTYYMLGDTLPVMVAGKQQARSLTVSGIVIDTDMTSADTPDNYEMWRHILAQARPVLYRDPSDVTMWAMLSAVRLDKTRTKHLWDVSFTLTEVEPANL